MSDNEMLCATEPRLQLKECRLEQETAKSTALNLQECGEGVGMWWASVGTS